MSAEIVALRGGTQQPVAGDVQANVVEWLEKALEDARAGALIGIAGICMYPSPVGTIMPITTFRIGWTASIAAAGGLSLVEAEILQIILQADD